MVNITPVPYMMTEATLKIETDNYEKTVDSVKLTPTTPTVIFSGIDGTQSGAVGDPTWMLGLGFAQDHITAASVSKYLLAHHGEIKTIEFTPQDGGDVYTVEVLCIPSEIGGDAGTLQKSTVSLPVVGQPIITT